MNILGNNLLAQYYAQNQGLPFGYEAVEYLESTGTQYIDANLNAPNGYVCKTSIKLNSTNTQVLIGTQYQYSSGTIHRNMLFVASGNWRLGVNTTEMTIQSVSLPPQKTNIEFSTQDSYYGKINDILKISGNVAFGTRSPRVYLFGETKYMARMQLYFCLLYISNILVRNFLPCVRKSDGKPGLYDLCKSICPLTGTPFYINSGTGEFTTP